jgi:hypothetical protein
VLFVTQSYSQDIFTTDWVLTDLYINGVNYDPPSNSEVSEVTASFTVDNPDYFESGVCNVMFADVIVEENPNILSFPNGMFITLSECNFSDNTAFESLYYFDFFESHINDPFSYEIGIIDGEGTYPDGLFLSITNSNGDAAYYLDTILSVSDVDLSKIKLFPNPTQDYFTVSSTTENDFSITIYDISGKEALSQSKFQNNSSVNIQNLKSGIYFISVLDESGNVSVKRIIKK